MTRYLTGEEDVVHEVGDSSSDSGRDTERPENLLEMEEHSHIEGLQVFEEDLKFVEKLGGDSEPLSFEFTQDGWELHSDRYVGVVSLPSGLRVEVTPKQTVTRLLWLLQYALDTPVSTVETATELSAADTFIDAFGALFHAELEQVLNQGIRREYIRTQEREDTIRGRLEIHKQIQSSQPVPTDFSVEYDSFTSDTTLNQAVLNAAQILSGLVRDDRLASNLVIQEKRLRHFVSPRPVSVRELENIDITRLNRHYEDLLELTRIVLSQKYFEDIRVGERRAFGMFVNMDSVFELVVERAFSEGARKVDRSLTVEGQGDIPELIEGDHSINMTPDIVVRKEDEVVLVGDAKWKTDDNGNHSQGDIYQITSYMLSSKTPGILVYPQQSGTLEGKSTVQEEFTLKSIELKTAADCDDYAEYSREITGQAESVLRGLL
jgi:5-methylcytosine-specific restriction enzyme subunit McrC